MKKRIVSLLLIGTMILSSVPFVESRASELTTVEEEKLQEEETVEEQTEVEETEEQESEIDNQSILDDTSETFQEEKVDDLEVQEEVSEEVPEVVNDAVQGRKVLNLNEGWNFTTNDSTTAGWNFPDGKSSGIVNLPHCWEYVHPTMSYIPQMNQKTTTYEKTVDISEIMNDNLFIKFYGSARNTEVLVDGEKVGTHVGGYSAFVFDLTDYVKGKEKITITVRVTNLDTISIPINVDYTQWAGIYRDVELISTDDQYFSLEDYGTNGIYIDTSVSGTTANVNLKAEISNKSIENEKVRLVTNIKGRDGEVVSEEEKEILLEGNKTVQEITDKYEISNVHLWNGTDDPYLYTMELSAYDEHDNLLDSISQKFGVRTYEIKNGKFYLNGNEYEIHGVGMHQDREGYGNAVPKQKKEQDFQVMQEMGVNAIRTAHYPHDSYVYELADERGMLVYSEIPYYLLLSNTESYKQSVTEQLKEMIRQGYNHPSIMMWGIQNEVYQSDSFASFGDDFKVDEATLVQFNSQLAELAQREDTTRYITQAEIDNKRANEVCAKWSRNGKVDYTGVNLYVGFKSNVSSGDEKGRKEITDTLNEKIDSYKKIYNSPSFMITEYGAGGNINQHETIDSDFSWDKSDEFKEYHYEEWQSFVLETNYAFIQSRNDIPVSFVWNMFDFSCYRNEGGIPRRNTKGLVCYDHETKKDVFYFYKANWNQNDKFVHLTSKRYTDRDSKNQQIKAYSNCKSVELFVNNKSVGMGRKQQSGVFVWDNVRLEDVNNFKVIGTDNGKRYSDEVSNISAKDKKTSVKYQVHIQKDGWLSPVRNGQTSGTTGEKLRMEALKVKLLSQEYPGTLEYRSHVQNKGWLDWTKDGEVSGTTGESLRLEAVQIRLTGEIEKYYDIYYRVHVQNFGWLDWAKNGEQAGTAGYGYRLEAIEIQLVEKGKDAPGETAEPMKQRLITYSSHIQNIGNQNYVDDGEISGSVGKSLRMEALRVTLPSLMNSSVDYCAHVQNIGWQNWVKKGELAGATGRKLRMEAVKLKLSGKAAEKYDIYYQVHVQNFGWLDWAKNGQPAGTEGYSYRMEGIRIKLVEKGKDAPGSTKRPFIKK